MTGKTKAILTAAGCFLAGMLVMLPRQWDLPRLRDRVLALRMAHLAREARASVAGHGTGSNDLTLPELLKEGGRNKIDLLKDALSYVDGLKPGQIAGALDALKKMPATYATNQIRSLLLARWGAENPADAMAWVKTTDLQANRFGDYRSLYQAWAAKDPVAAVTGLKQIGDAGLQANIENQILGMMSLANPQKAMDLLHQFPNSQQSTMALSYIYYYWAGVDPAAAAASAMTLPVSGAQRSALQNLSYAWARQDPQAALAFASSLPNGGPRQDDSGGV